MATVLTDEIARFVAQTGPEPDETLREMDAFARREGFPHVGPEVGAFCRLLARLVGPQRIFEFGSGYGYSAYWLAAALPDDGEIVLTEFDEDELERAPDFLAAGGYDGLAHYELGDAMETIERYDGPFDLVLIDHQKERYVDAFEAVREKVPVGGVIVADNMLQSDSLEFDTLLEMAEAGELGALERGEREVSEVTRGVGRFLERVRSDPAFETLVVPLGEGISVSYRLE
ncbi:O-methyltransferase [Natronobiforma cellulositropha]|uniref:O-methyltransferase n=1 Tax=Natronobiforma cellulositropha TaxID=1679076 RepID=UPI0021D5AF60|nr:O-methyltransferase [Natronobiforma cellulositropha]